MVIDLFMVYQFIKRLATPFVEWEAYKQGVIDEDGNILIPKKERRLKPQRDSFGSFDLLVLKLKKLLGKIPGGQSKLASYGAALWLIKEWNYFSDDSVLTEEIIESLSESQINESIYFLKAHVDYITEKTDVKQKMQEEPTISAGSGYVAGIGVGPDGEPGLTQKQMKRYKSKNKKGKRLRDVLGEKKDAPDDVCWPGYEMVGFKMKNGKKVPNCVPKEK